MDDEYSRFGKYLKAKYGFRSYRLAPVQRLVSIFLLPAPKKELKDIVDDETRKVFGNRFAMSYINDEAYSAFGEGLSPRIFVIKILRYPSTERELFLKKNREYGEKIGNQLVRADIYDYGGVSVKANHVEIYFDGIYDWNKRISISKIKQILGNKLISVEKQGGYNFLRIKMKPV